MALTVAQVDAAIAAVLDGGQSYTIGDRTYNRADLATLEKMRKDADAIERGTSRGIFQRVRFGRVR